MGFRLNSPYVEPYYEGGIVTSTVPPGSYDAFLDGIPLMIDWSAERPLSYSPVPFTRTQSDTSNIPGEQTVNPEGLWRRSGESWHFGAGQDDFDRDTADLDKPERKYRFDDSFNINVWDKYEFKLHKDTDLKDADAETNLNLAVAGTRLYYVHGTSIHHISDITPDTPTLTACTGHPANPAVSITSDGFHVWTAHTSNGIYRTDTGTNAMASQVTGNVDIVKYVHNRLLASKDNLLYDVTAVGMGGAGALPAAFFTHPNSGFDFVGFAEGNQFIYAAGKSGDKSIIYKIGIAADGTALTAPMVAGVLPDGEVITSIDGYLGKFISIGTEKGLRFAVANEDGNLVIGARIDTTSPVLAFEPQDNFVWYGLGNFSDSHTGLGRLSTSTFTDLDNLVPAYASDLMVEEQGNITAIVTFQNLRVFTVHNQGLYAEHETRLAPEGYIDTGRISYGMTEAKIGIWFDFTHKVSTGHHEVFVSYDEAAFISLGSHSGADMHTNISMFIGVVSASTFNFRIMLMRDETDDTEGMVFKSWLFRVQPTAEPTDNILATVYLNDEIEDQNEVTHSQNPYEILSRFTTLRKRRHLARWQQGDVSWNVFLEDFDMMYKALHTRQSGARQFNASCLLKMKVVN